MPEVIDQICQQMDDAEGIYGYKETYEIPNEDVFGIDEGVYELDFE